MEEHKDDKELRRDKEIQEKKNRRNGTKWNKMKWLFAQ